MAGDQANGNPMRGFTVSEQAALNDIYHRLRKVEVLEPRVRTLEDDRVALHQELAGIRDEQRDIRRENQAGRQEQAKAFNAFRDELTKVHRKMWWISGASWAAAVIVGGTLSFLAWFISHFGPQMLTVIDIISKGGGQ